MDKNAFTLLSKIVIFAVILQSKLHRLHPEEWQIKSSAFSSTLFTLSQRIFRKEYQVMGKFSFSTLASLRSFINFRASLLR